MIVNLGCLLEVCNRISATSDSGTEHDTEESEDWLNFTLKGTNLSFTLPKIRESLYIKITHKPIIETRYQCLHLKRFLIDMQMSLLFGPGKQ